MTQTSKIALLTSVAVITMAMTGCGGSNNRPATTTPTPVTPTPVTPTPVTPTPVTPTPVTPTPVTPTPVTPTPVTPTPVTPTPVTPTPVTPTPETPVDDCVPAALKVPATLDQNTTALTLRTALVSQQIGYLFAGGEGFGESSTEKQTPKKVSKLASALSTKIQTLQKNTASVKKALSSGNASLEHGENIACDLSGTYSLSEENNNTSTGDEGNNSSTSTNKVTLSFNTCVMDVNDYGDALEFFEKITLDTSIANRLTDREASTRTETFNGAVTLEYNSDYSNTSSSFNDNPTPQDDGTRDEDTDAGSTRFVSEGLSVECKDDNTTTELFTSTQVLSATVDSVSSRENNNSYETQTNEGNYTNTVTNAGQYVLNASFEGNETQQYFGDVNTTTALTACNVTVESTSNYEYVNEYVYVGKSQASYGQNSTYEYSTKLSGYLVLQDGEEGLDLYADALTVVGTYGSFSSNEASNDTQSYTLSGTVGSTLIGGSVVLSTPSAWLASSEYPEHRQQPTEDLIGDLFTVFVYYSPYAGSTVLTGANTATVAFLLDGENVTYGTITIQGQEPVEYGSIEAMGIAYID